MGIRSITPDVELFRCTSALEDKTCERIRILTRTRGEVRFFFEDSELIVSCAWRLDSEFEVLCGVGNSQRKGGLVHRELQSVVGRRIVSVQVENPGKDLALIFESGRKLSIFCDRSGETDGPYSYVLTNANATLAVGGGGRVERVIMDG